MNITWREEFEAVALEHLDSIYRGALWMSGDDTAAQDLVQDVYLKAYRFFDKFEAGTSFKAWLFKILKTTYINLYRQRLRRPFMVDLDSAEIVGSLTTKRTPEDEVFDRLLDDDVVNAVNALPEDYRLVIVLVDLEGFKYKEAADILDIPMGTVMSRLNRGRKLLRRALSKYAREKGYVS